MFKYKCLIFCCHWIFMFLIEYVMNFKLNISVYPYRPNWILFPLLHHWLWHNLDSEHLVNWMFTASFISISFRFWLYVFCSRGECSGASIPRKYQQEIYSQQPGKNKSQHFKKLLFKILYSICPLLIRRSSRQPAIFPFYRSSTPVPGAHYLKRGKQIKRED